MGSMQDMAGRMENFMARVDDLETRQRANQISKEQLEESIRKILEMTEIHKEELDIATNAISILRAVSDEAVQKSYDFIVKNINDALSRIFSKTKRKIKLREWTRQGQYPQLEIELYVEGGVKRSLRTGSGHGLMQIISLLCVLSLIVITNSRRVLAVDETMSGLSAESRQVVSEILWAFTEIGFQFIISEYGFIPRGAKVYQLRLSGGVSSVDKEYIEKKGVYLDGPLEKNKEYSGGESTIQIIEGEPDGEDTDGVEDKVKDKVKTVPTVNIGNVIQI